MESLIADRSKTINAPSGIRFNAWAESMASSSIASHPYAACISLLNFNHSQLGSRGAHGVQEILRRNLTAERAVLEQAAERAILEQAAAAIPTTPALGYGEYNQRTSNYELDPQATMLSDRGNNSVGPENNH
jgi:hypothetical protein